MTRPNAARRLLLVHAHPDDEAITTGATMAMYAAEGVHVTLVTCTAGEEGEVIVPELQGMTADREDRLAEVRVTELASAMAALGVSDHRFLGGIGRYRDSGMMGAPSNDRSTAFWRADLDEAAGHLVKIIREVRPQVLITYDKKGGYGHPDHIMAHHTAVRAATLAADPYFAPGSGPTWDIAKIYWTVMPESALQHGIDAVKAAGDAIAFQVADSLSDLPFGIDDSIVTTYVDGSAHLEGKRRGMQAHLTQISMSGGFFALSNGIGQEVSAHEYYQIAKGEIERPGREFEEGLFGGLSADSTDAGGPGEMSSS